eukprot:408825-Pyramimonas_sp.AAC.1
MRGGGVANRIGLVSALHAYLWRGAGMNDVLPAHHAWPRTLLRALERKLIANPHVYNAPIAGEMCMRTCAEEMTCEFE